MVGKVEAMACALPHNASLLSATVAGFGYWLAHDFTNPNWWYATIGIPVEMATILLNVERSGDLDSLSKAQQAKALELMERSGYEHTSWTGANLADVMKVQIARGLIFGNASGVGAGFGRVWPVSLYLTVSVVPQTKPLMKVQAQ
jgi:hypothetical protein